jgi:hypothetical protein
VEQKDKLADLVNEVDQEAQKFTSFDDYLAAREQQNGKDEQTEWKKSVSDAAASLPSNGSEKVGETDESSNPSSAEPVSAPKSPEEKKTPPPIPPRVEIPQPLAATPLFEAEPQPEHAAKSIDYVVTKLQIVETEWVSGGAFVSEQQFAVPEPNEPNSVYLSGRNFSVTAATDEQVISKFHEIEASIYRAREFQKGLRSGLAERLSGQSSERKAKIKELDKTKQHILQNNKGAAARIKADRAPVVKGGLGIKLSDAYATMGDTAEEMCEKLKALGKLDAATIAHIEKNYGKGAK